MSFPRNGQRPPQAWWPVLLGAVLLPTAVIADPAAAVTRSLDQQSALEATAQDSQRRIDRLDDRTQAMLDEYRDVLRETESLRRYNRQLEALIGSQTREMQGIGDQLARIESTNRDIYPHMRDMLATLERFVELDMPFLPDERRARLETLAEIMDRADVTASEKYRRLIEAYGVEVDYGRTLEAYQGEQLIDGATRTVDFLRVGRVALLYQTLDGGESGYWDREAGRWVADSRHAATVRDGLRLARRQAAPELLVLPVPAPKGEQ